MWIKETLIGVLRDRLDSKCVVFVLASIPSSVLLEASHFKIKLGEVSVIQRNIRKLLFVPFLLGGHTACFGGTDVIDGTTVACTSDSECPSGYVCSESLRRCVDAAFLGEAGPTLVGSVSPRFATMESSVLVQFVASRTLGREPDVRLQGEDGETNITGTGPFVLERAVDRTYSYRYTPTGVEPEREYRVVATLADTSGNQSENLVVGTLSLDFTPPGLAAPSTVTPMVAQAGTEVRIRLVASESINVDPAVEPRLQLSWPMGLETSALEDLEMRASTANEFEFRYTPSGNEPTEPAALTLRWEDLAGNRAVVGLQSVLEFDFSPPTLTVVGPAIVPPPTSLRESVSAATRGSRIVASVLALEDLGGLPEMRLEDIEGNEVVRVVGTVVEPNEYALDMELMRSLNLADGEYRAWIEARSLLPGQIGNLIEHDLGTILFDATPPQTPDVLTPNVVTYRRNPWGSESTDGQFAFTIEAAAGSLVDDGDSFLVALDRKDVATAIEVGRGPVLSDGSVAPFDIVAADFARAFVVAVDRAGNVSDFEPSEGAQGIRVRDVVWTATLNGKVSGSAIENPHRLVTTPLMLGSLQQHDNLVAEPAALNALFRDDGLRVNAVSNRVWLDRQVTSSTPSPRNQHAAAYDAVRGKLVVFGGFDDFGRSAETWEFDGSFWSRIAPPTSPSARVGHAMAFDSKRGMVTLFGGNHAGNLLDDTWLWNGEQWTRVLSSSPPAREYHRMSYDRARAVIVMFGGRQGSEELGDTWEWDGQSWSEATSTGLSPEPRDSHSMVFDERFGTTVMYGGITAASSSFLNDSVWEWDGEVWERYVVSGSRPVPQRNAMAFDLVRRRLLLFGERTWEWTMDRQWVSVSANRSPPGREYPTLNFANGMSGVLLFGGGRGSDCNTGECLNDLWLWNGDTWVVLNEGIGSYPRARDRMVAVYHEGIGRFSMFGGFAAGDALDDLWMWSGAGWFEQTSAGPSARFRSSGTYDRNRDRLWLFGGLDPNNGCSPGDPMPNHCGDLWSWDPGNGWLNNVTAGPPEPRSAPAIAYDSARDRLLLFGGTGCTLSSCTNATCADTWEFDPAGAWTLMSSPTNPPALSRHAMVYDENRERIVLFGGVLDEDPNIAPCATDGVQNETWEWGIHGAAVCGSAATPCWRAMTVNGAVPPARASHSLVYDRGRMRVVLFGGQANDVSERFGDTWEWNGTSWRELATVSTAPAARFGQGLAYDPVRQKVVLFGGVGETSTWELDADPSQRPAALISFELSFLGVDVGAIDEFTVRARARGRGYDIASDGDGTLLDGAALSLWSAGAGRWVEVTTSVDDVLDYDTGSVSEAQGYITPESRVFLAIQPMTGIGNGPAPSNVSVDYVELEVTMRR